MGWQNTWESDSRRPRHPGSQRPDGRRPNRRHHVDPLLRTKMSTSSGDELNMGHFHCRNRLCMITRTSIAVDELRHVIDHRHLSLHKTGMQQPVQSSTSCNSGSSAVSSTSALENCWTCTTNVDHLVNVLQLENLCGKTDHGNLHLRHDRGFNDVNQRIQRAATVGSRLSSHRQQRRICTTCKHGHRPPCPHGTGETLWSDRTVGICVCAVKEMSTTLKNCNCGISAV